MDNEGEHAHKRDTSYIVLSVRAEVKTELGIRDAKRFGRSAEPIPLVIGCPGRRRADRYLFVVGNVDHATGTDAGRGRYGGACREHHVNGPISVCSVLVQRLYSYHLTYRYQQS